MNENEAWFRFYEELNDFLPSYKRKTSFPFQFRGNPSVKDAIESIGIPHVEIDMILVNSNSVDFSYKMQNGDVVSVYPVFESLDIKNVQKLRAKPLRNPKFILDVHLGRLSKYLRLCGFDSIFQKSLTDRQIVDISVTDKRIILTRDRGLLKSKKVTHGYWIRSSKPKEQLKEVIERLDLMGNINPFTRCLVCNGLLRKVQKEIVIDSLPERTKDFYTEFRKCNDCGRIYWEGSHYERMRKFLLTIQDEPV
ncbi:MAG: Mut7-C RNAse domain-containing protein [Bacteroidota bacterium]|nr:Mut7-C RNAse domain-containing protein [Bacteroidota bacterium]